jgi:hypothetical protein
MTIQDLQPGDYPEYYRTYISHLPTDDLIEILNKQSEEMNTFFRSLKIEDLRTSYAPGKWTVAQVLQHMIDTERIFQYRALRIARNDCTPLAGYDQDAYVSLSSAASRDLESFNEEYNAVRQSGIQLFKSFTYDMFIRKGISNDKPLSAAAAAFIIAGHEKHHLLLFKSNYNL